jgi:hypothetical protein
MRKPMYVTEERLRAYIEEFHKNLDSISSQFFSPEQARELFHNSLLPAKVTCYVSTQFGVAFEYTKAETTAIDTVRGSSRIEDLIVQAPKRLRSVGPLFNIGGSGVRFECLTLADGFPFRLNNLGANVTFQNVRFTCDALHWVRDLEYGEIYGNRQLEHWTLAQAENRAKDEILAALFLAQQANSKSLSIHEYVSSIQEKTVLVLRSYDQPGEKRLIEIAGCLRNLGYEPLFIRDVPDFEQYDLPQKVTAIGALTRFVVIDDSAPSGHLNEVEICRHNRWFTILLRAHGRHASWMTAGAANSSNVILEKEYDPSNPYPSVEESVGWVEARMAEMKDSLNQLYPWRKPS